eukprot:1517224-Rhodomonas_salina.2
MASFSCPSSTRTLSFSGFGSVIVLLSSNSSTEYPSPCSALRTRAVSIRQSSDVEGSSVWLSRAGCAGADRA